MADYLPYTKGVIPRENDKRYITMFKSKKQEETNTEEEVKVGQQEAGNQENVKADEPQAEAAAEKAGENAGEQGEAQAEPSAEEQLTAKLAEANDKYIRLAAEFDNYRRRVAKEKLDLISTAGEDVIKGLLPVLDDCERALQVLNSSTDSEAAKAAKEGTELIYNKLMGYLKSKGLAPIEAVGKELDTDFHEAVAQFPVQEAEKKNKIFDVTQQGYTLNGKVIRFAKVVVGI